MLQMESYRFIALPGESEGGLSRTLHNLNDSRMGQSFPKGREPVILLAMPYLTMGGAEASVSRICRQLRQCGCRIFLVTTERAEESQGNTKGWFEPVTEEIHDLPELLPDTSLWPDCLFSLMRRAAVDVLWQVGASYVYSLLPQIRRRFPEIVAVDLLFNPIGHTEKHLLYGKFIDQAVVEHEGMRAWLLERGVRGEKITIIPNGIDLKEYSPRPPVDWRTRQPRIPGGGGFVAAFIGRLSEEKGPDLFLEIAAALATDSGMEFLVCGTGPMEPALKDLVRRKGLNERVHFLGPVSTREYLPCCDAVIVSSRQDGRPNIVMESLAMGIPVIASRVGGIPAMLPEGLGGVTCEPDDVASFVRAIRSVAGGREQWGRHSTSARKHAETHFSAAAAGAGYALLFTQLRRQRERFLAFRRVGAAVRRFSDALTGRRLWKAVRATPKNLLLACRLWHTGTWKDLTVHFDSSYYAGANPVLKIRGLALLHYLFWGFLQGRDPSPRFQTRGYLSANPDVARSGVNPLLHYVAFGRTERRDVRPASRGAA
jgi:glycosyltransferase involved in cell wall biosynthesis